MTKELAERIVLHLLEDLSEWKISQKYKSGGVPIICINRRDTKYIWLDFFPDKILVDSNDGFSPIPSVEYSNPDFFNDLREAILGPPAGSQKNHNNDPRFN